MGKKEENYEHFNILTKKSVYGDIKSIFDNFPKIFYLVKYKKLADTSYKYLYFTWSDYYAWNNNDMKMISKKKLPAET